MELDNPKIEKVVQQMREQSSKEIVYWEAVAKAIEELNARGARHTACGYGGCGGVRR